MSTSERKEQLKKAAAKSRAKKRGLGYKRYERTIKKEHEALMDARLADLNKTGV